MNMLISKIIEQIESRLQFVITLNTLFLTLVYAIAKLAGKTEDVSQVGMLQTSMLIALYLIAYVIFEVRKDHISLSGLKWISSLILVGIACFVVPILIFSLSTLSSTTLVPHWQTVMWLMSFIVSTYGLIIIPVITVAFVLFWNSFRFKKR